MNKRGHIIFALALGVIAVYIVSNFITIETKLLLIHLPFYFIGALIVDKIESSKHAGIKHRKFLHSYIMLLLTILLIIPFLYWKTKTSPTNNFLGATYSYWSFGLATALGHTTHLLGDSLTSKLPRY